MTEEEVAVGAFSLVFAVVMLGLRRLVVRRGKSGIVFIIRFDSDEGDKGPYSPHDDWPSRVVIREEHTSEEKVSFGDAATVGAAASEPYAQENLPVQTITMNGFTILDEEAQHPRNPAERLFTVVGPGGEEQVVVVEIDAEAVGYVERMTRRRLPPENSFWTVQAKRLLSDFLWSEGRVPPTGKLAVADVGLDVLPVAERWQKGAEE